MRQQKMQEGLAILENHNFFDGCSYAKLVQIAFSMQCVNISARKKLATAGDPVVAAYVISKGHITVYAPPQGTGIPRNRGYKGGVFSSLRLAVSQWGHGFMIGEVEVVEGSLSYGCSYETATECEVFEIPRKYLEVSAYLRQC